LGGAAVDDKLRAGDKAGVTRPALEATDFLMAS